MRVYRYSVEYMDYFGHKDKAIINAPNKRSAKFKLQVMKRPYVVKVTKGR